MGTNYDVIISGSKFEAENNNKDMENQQQNN